MPKPNQFRLTMALGNAAFTGCAGDEIARILRSLADRMDGLIILMAEDFPLIDANGNRVGAAELTGEDV